MSGKNLAHRKDRADDVLADMADFAATLLHGDFGLAKKDAKDAAECLVEAIRLEWGGSMCYFKKTPRIELEARDEEIYERFDGTNHAELTREYGITRQRIYQIVNAMRARRLTSRSGKPTIIRK